MTFILFCYRLEISVEPWMDSLWPAVRQFLGLPPEDPSNMPAEGTVDARSKSSTKTTCDTTNVSSDNETKNSSAIDQNTTTKQENDVDTTTNIGPVINRSSDDKTAEISNDCNDMAVSHGDTADETEASQSSLMDVRQTDVGGNEHSPNCQSTQTDCHTDIEGGDKSQNCQLTDTDKIKDGSNSKKDPSPTECDCSMGNSGASEQPGVESLKHSLPPLSESALNVPALPPPFLKIDFLHGQTAVSIKFVIYDSVFSIRIVPPLGLTKPTHFNRLTIIMQLIKRSDYFGEKSLKMLEFGISDLLLK